MNAIPKRVIALNYYTKNCSCLDTVKGVNLYTEKCGDESLEDSVYMSPDSYKFIFKKTRTNDNRNRLRLAVVKITSRETHRSIFRKYVYNPRFKGLKISNLALSPSSIRELGDNHSIIGKEVWVSPGSVFCYFWNHPFHATRIATKIGVFSIVLAILSMIVSFLLYCPLCR